MNIKQIPKWILILQTDFQGSSEFEKSRGGQKVLFSCFLVAKFPVDTPSCGRIPPSHLLWV